MNQLAKDYVVAETDFGNLQFMELCRKVAHESMNIEAAPPFRLWDFNLGAKTKELEEMQYEIVFAGVSQLLWDKTKLESFTKLIQCRSGLRNVRDLVRPWSFLI